MSEFYKELPDYIKKREEKENLKWFGHDTSFEIFPHLNLDWQKLSTIYRESKKPIGDLGASFSTIPTEGELRGMDIMPIDIMHEANKSRYSAIVEKEFFYDIALSDVYKKRNPYEGSRLTGETQKTMGTDTPRENYLDDVRAAIKKVVDKYIVADLANIPLKNRALSISIVSDAVPKHSPSLEIFLQKQLPEILRVTDRAAYIYPMSIYKAILWKGRFDYEADEIAWKKVSDLTPEEIKEEQLYKSMNPETHEEEYSEKITLEEMDALYKNPEIIKQITEAAEKLGFEFSLEKGSKTEREEYRERGNVLGGDPFTLHKQREAMLGIFTRKS